ncbi:sensor histidine kinase [Heyndrickxia coagulans]|jgi:two-component system sensor histidine kinase DegS|uniref:Signal transduction histidine-protein kinase/phosphatase DegS n=2 Tax=Heyndrickxia coagulans TaxID=1398 RepID=A0AAW7C9W8_HEYCO|nr:sensor histidine kinase [Heyndrickxia coagulans]AJH79774.1 sensor protein degS [Heyndrickxia coagulans DSM 1 = ATCC 7050]MCR2846517.1 sensor histidine kinase [Heyndrickxia coagulans]MDL5040048.1 sensor histidine kinase [Heyndrickxia coagulans]MDR4224670.1 histidine kinase [Heyndrickxia coagulans DSM 1 = ATCC 7050]MED4493060.1 sensor histidine kinase [Heyndrickxia coagulans]
MTFKTFDSKALDAILEKMVATVEESKHEIFEIGERCRQDYDALINELEEVKATVAKVIEQTDELETKSKFARRRLAEVSQHFRDFSEKQVREAYEKAHTIQIQLSMNRQRELQLRERRNELERRLYSLKDTIDRANHLVSQTTVVLNYLTSDLQNISEAIEDAKHKQEFGLRVIEAQEEERKRISREIHDGPAQMLANMLLRSDLVEKIYHENGMEEAIAEMRTLKELVRDSLKEVRRIIYDLRPMALDDLGLIPTLKKYLSTIENYKGSPVITYRHLGEERRLPTNYEIALFRLIQESVQNALKHAKATEIQVKSELRKNSFIATVKDNGTGFDVRSIREGAFGIVGMRERVSLLNGEISIHSKRGAGTLVIIQIPMQLDLEKEKR